MRFSASWEGEASTRHPPAAAAAGGGEQNGNHDDDKDSTGDENPLHGDLLWSDGVGPSSSADAGERRFLPGAFGKRLRVRGVLDSWEQ
jgi:hypothetical protein